MKKAICFLLLNAALYLQVLAEPGLYDSYGGWTKLKGTRTGFFHTEKINSRWWLVSPEGNVFFSKGVCNISYTPDVIPSLNFSPYEKTNREKYGTPEKWAHATSERLRGWNFNTVGAWSSMEMNNVGLAYAMILDMAASANEDLWLKGGFPDLFDPSFRKGLERVAKEKCADRKSDPWLLGYFTDNELRWGPDWRSKESLLESYMKLPESKPGHQVAVTFLKERGHSKENLDAADKADFQQKVAAEYGRLCREAILRYDPNHMVIGCRFGGYAPDPVLRGLGPYLDVISYNNYSAKAPLEMLTKLTSLTGKPTMVTEFSFKAMDSGLPNTKGAGKPLATQRERASYFTNYVQDLAALPGCVGFHWFEYCDEPKEGRFDGENSNYGLVKIDDAPWEVLTEQMKKVNAEIEFRAAKTGK